MDDAQDIYQRYVNAYSADECPPWDTGIVPPEVQALVDSLPPGSALDVGCGTGVSAVFLAQHGWQVTGVDWVALAVAQARARAAAAGLAAAQVRFLQADVAAADFLPGHEPVDLWLDIGCLHGLPEAAQAVYAGHAARLVRPGGILRLYTWRDHMHQGWGTGISPAVVAQLFAPHFTLAAQVFSEDHATETRPSAWYLLRRFV